MASLTLVLDIRRRLLSGIGANVVGQAISVGTQLLSIPIFLSSWSAGHYGVWLLIVTIPAYVLLGDFGFTAVAMNRMTILGASGRHRAAVRLFQSLLGLLSVVSALMMAAVLICVMLAPAEYHEIALSASVVVISTLVHLYTGAFDGIFRANGRYAKGTLYLELARLAEWLGMIAGYLVGGSFYSTAIGMLLGRLGASSVLAIYCHRRYPVYEWKPRFAKVDFKYLFGLRKSAFAWVSMKISDSIALQGLTILVGIHFGTVAVAQFNAFRTLSRLVVQGVSALSNSLWPEYARVVSLRDGIQLRMLAFTSISATAVSALVAATFIFIVSEPFMELWTNGKIDYDERLLVILLAYAVLAAIWYTCRILLVAANRLAKLSVVYVILTGALFAFILLIGTFSLYLVPLGMALVELAMLLISVGLVRRVVLK